MAGYPTHPAHPERVCWGCDEYCPAHDLTCGKDTVRTPHPLELFGADWDGGLGTESQTERESADETTRARVVEALRSVLDPSLGLNIVDLGILHDVRVDGARVRVSLTLPPPSCALGQRIRGEAERRLRVLKGVGEVQVFQLVHPAWSVERATPELRAALGSRRSSAAVSRSASVHPRR